MTVATPAIAVPASRPPAASASVEPAIAEACAAIAPTWPLDRFIAVNPFWGWVDRPLPEAAAHLGALAGSRLTAPRSLVRQHWAAGALRVEHLQAATARAGADLSTAALVAALDAPDTAPERLPLLADVHGVADLVTHQISQHCAAYFDPAQSRWSLDRSGGLYASWRRQIAVDRGLPWRGGQRRAATRIAALPAEPAALIAALQPVLGLDEAGLAPYLTAALLATNGWAAWCSHQRWQSRLAGTADAGELADLLAIRAAWEWLLAEDRGVPAGWAAQWNTSEQAVARIAAEQRLDWLLQAALELSYQQPLIAGLAAAGPDGDASPASTPDVQAAFCIDVRSEVFRRALEGVDAGIATKGFAGFFGLPIAYAPTGSTMTRPQLPGLLAPALTASEPSLGQVIAARRRSALQWKQRWADLRGAASSGFSFVEACGLAYGAKLVAACLPGTQAAGRWEDTGLPKAARGAAPRLDIDDASATDIAAKVLGAMGLVAGFAPLVLLAGHGSQTENNPHAAGLDCGACGGQTGEVNARVLAELLNRPGVRSGLVARGIAIPPATRFVPGLHNTTTDDVTLYDTDGVPAAALQRLTNALAEAATRARAERAPSLALAALADDAEALATTIRRRANDWSEVRPEWGLVNNAAFVAAPRARTRHLKLDGRVFLHDYAHGLDGDGSVLELILTAPVVVAHWINFQYHASTLDNRRWGSGDKVLHNVVGGRLGVFEGNGGDLRIGLPMQSLHDGRDWRHTPLRLSVFVEAPRAAIDGVIAKHAVVRQLVEHGWLHLFAIEGATVHRRAASGRWADETPPAAGADAAALTAALRSPAPLAAGG